MIYTHDHFPMHVHVIRGDDLLILTVNDPHAAFDRAIPTGATVVTPVTEDYGWLVKRRVDPFGHHWAIGKPLDAAA